MIRKLNMALSASQGGSRHTHAVADSAWEEEHEVYRLIYSWKQGFLRGSENLKNVYILDIVGNLRAGGSIVYGSPARAEAGSHQSH